MATQARVLRFELCSLMQQSRALLAQVAQQLVDLMYLFQQRLLLLAAVFMGHRGQSDTRAFL